MIYIVVLKGKKWVIEYFPQKKEFHKIGDDVTYHLEEADFVQN